MGVGQRQLPSVPGRDSGGRRGVRQRWLPRWAWCHGDNQLKMWMGEMLFTLRQYGELDSAEGVLEENNSGGMLGRDTRP